jgi:SOS-response transcriptional repressor LexA
MNHNNESSQKSNLALLKMLQEKDSKSSTLPHKSRNKVEASSPRNSKSEENLEVVSNIFATEHIRNRTQNDAKVSTILTKMKSLYGNNIINYTFVV